VHRAVIPQSNGGVEMRVRFKLWVMLVVCIAGGVERLRGEETGLWSNGDGKTIKISEDGNPVLVYQIEETSLDGKWPRAGYVHPLYDLKGEVMTEDFPDDHKHHRGVFWAWHHLSVGDLILGDPWLCKDFVRQCVQSTQHVIQVRGEECIGIELKTLWKSPLLKDLNAEMLPIVEERARIIIHPSTARQRLIDFDISLTAMLRDVRIGGSDDVKGYGGFSPRIKLNSKQVFRFESGEVEPKKVAIQGGPWVDISDQKRGLTIMTHPENPVANRSSQTPEAVASESETVASESETVASESETAGQDDQQSRLWILRRKRSMQNAVYPGRTPVPLSKDNATRLRYRLVVHDGQMAAERLQAIYNEFAGDP